MKESEKKFIVPIILFLIGILLHVLSLANWATVEVKRQNIVDTGSGWQIDISGSIKKYGLCSMGNAEVDVIIYNRRGNFAASEIVNGYSSFKYQATLSYSQLPPFSDNEPFTVEARINRVSFSNEKLRNWSYVFLCGGLTIGIVIYLENRNKITA